MKNSKKIISLMLCLALVFSTFACLGSFTISAAGTEAAGKRDLADTDGIWWYSDTKTTVPYSSGSGTSGDPYIVTTAAQLRLLARGGTDTAGKYYQLGNDIVLNDTTYADWYERSGLTNWIKGSDATGEFTTTRNDYELSSTLFRGTLDGNGYTVSGLYINYEGSGRMASRTAVGWALFPSVQGATIKNLKLIDVYIKSNVSMTCQNAPHGYGALIGYSYYDGATVSNVHIEDVKFDIQSPNQNYTNYRIGVGSLIGYATGPFTATDCIVKNISGKAVNKYFTGTGKPGSAGSLIGFVAGDISGSKHTLKNIISIGRMNPLSANVADPAFVTTNTDTAIPLSMPIRSGSTATNVYAIGDVSILANSGITKAVDEATFKSTYLDTFYNGIGTSTNWSVKNSNEVPYLKLFPPVEDNKENAATLICNFGDYDPSVAGKALTNWSIVDTSGNKSLKGDFTSSSLGRDNFGFIVGSYAYGVNGPLVPGKIYKLEFKAKADNAATMNYALYNGSTYAYTSIGDHIVENGYDAFGRRTAQLTTEWQEFSTYFTFDSYTNTNDPVNGVNRPYFFIQPSNSIWGNNVYFDDMVLTECDGVSFALSDNHYYEPTIGEIGEAITLPNTPIRDGYDFGGWYVDEDCTIALDVESTKIGDITVAYAKWVDGLTCDFSNYATTEIYSGTPNADSTWKVLTDAESGNKYLQGNFATVTAASSFAFTITSNNAAGNGTYTGYYPWGVNGPIKPGKTYMVSFKAKAKNNCTIDYAIYNGYSYALNSGEQHRYYDLNNNLCYEETGNLAKLTSEWATYTAYFTADEYACEGGTNRPIFYITNRDNGIWNNEFYFDDFVFTPCANYVSYNLYNGKYAKPFVADNGTAIVAVSPERKDYIFEGWYQDADFTNEFTATTVSGEAVAYAKWSEAVTELEKATLDTGVNDLGIKVTNANAYPVKFSLVTDGEVTVSIFTASADASVDKSIVWERTFERGGNVGALIEPAVINGGNKLYISVDGSTASISEFVIGGEGVPTTRNVEGDVNGDKKFDVLDLVKLKKMSVGTSAITWLGDLDEDSFVAEATDLIAIRKGLLGISSVVTTMDDRTLVWNDEFDGNGVNYSNFSYSNLEGTNKFNTNSTENINVSDGKLNLSVSNLDGSTYKVPCRVITQDKVAFNRGYLEVRAKISATPGQWAGIWLSGKKGDNPFGEIDIMETNASGTSFKPNIHSWDTEGNRLGQLGDEVESYDYAEKDFNKTEYHIFGFEWNETELKFYVDGVCYATLNINDVENTAFPGESLLEKSYPFAGIFDQFYCVKFDNNIYDNLSADGAMPEFDIDYVRLYQKDGEQLKINGELVEK